MVHLAAGESMQCCNEMMYLYCSLMINSLTVSIDPVIGSVYCLSTYLTILQCSYATNPSGCYYSDQVAVTCCKCM